MERDSRIPDEIEIDAIVETTGEWSTNDVKYLNYLQAIKNLSIFKLSMLINAIILIIHL